MAQLIIVNGAPGSGKTTLGRWLAAQTQLPILGKDDVKEFLFDALGYSNRDWSRILGRASTEMLYVLAREFLTEDQTVIIENAFWPQYATPTLRAIAKELRVDVIEIYCYSDEETRMQRFRDRYESGERHSGHVDNLATLRDVADYQPLAIGSVIRVDTTTVDDATYDRMYAELVPMLKKEG